MSNWSRLPIDLLAEITGRLELYKDFVVFGSVCSSWRSFALMEKPRFVSNLTVWLMLAPEKRTNLRGFFSLKEDLTRKVLLPEAEGNARRCFSSQGWLLTIGKNFRAVLLHPFLRVQIELPHMKAFKPKDDSVPHITFLHKFVLSSNPLYTSDYIVVVLHAPRGDLSYYKPGDTSWTTIKSSYCDAGSYNSDVTYYKGLFYAINYGGQIIAYDVRSNMAVQVAHMPLYLRKASPHFYIVESAGVLLVVSRLGTESRPIEGVADNFNIITVEESSKIFSYGTYEIQVLEVDLGNNSWMETKNLGNRTLFVGYNSSFSIELSYCKSNCIYFTDDCLAAYFSCSPIGGGTDMGIYNIMDGSIEPHFKGRSYSRINPPMWLQPFFH